MDYFGPLLNSPLEGIELFFAPPPLLGPLLNSLAAGRLPFAMPPGVVGPELNSLAAGILTLTSASGALMAPKDIEVDIVEVGIVAQATVRAPMKQSIVARLRA